MDTDIATAPNGSAAPSPISRVASAARNLFTRDLTPVEAVPAEPAPEPARGRSWVWPAKPDQVPTPFDQRISETAGEVDAAQSAWEQSVEAVFAARDDFAGATAAQPLDPRQLERARRAYQEARARQSDAGSKLQRARVRLQVLENARSRWTVAQW